MCIRDSLKTEYDLYYVRNISLRLDALIVCRTLGYLFRKVVAQPRRASVSDGAGSGVHFKMQVDQWGVNDE